MADCVFNAISAIILSARMGNNEVKISTASAGGGRLSAFQAAGISPSILKYGNGMKEFPKPKISFEPMHYRLRKNESAHADYYWRRLLGK